MTDAPAISARRGHFLLRNVRKALRDFNMLCPGDRVAVAVSGGKDSLSLLQLLRLNQRSWPDAYFLAAVHVRGDARGEIPPHAPLEAWLACQDVPYRVVSPDPDPGEALPMTCQRCTWYRRKAIFRGAEALGCNVVAFAHHADDAAHTTLMNLLQGGHVSTFAPAADYFGGRIRLIRPLFYVPERELARYARSVAFPEPPPRCPRANETRRARVAEMMRLLGREYASQARPNLIRAGLKGLELELDHDDPL